MLNGGSGFGTLIGGDGDDLIIGDFGEISLLDDGFALDARMYRASEVIQMAYEDFAQLEKPMVLDFVTT